MYYKVLQSTGPYYSLQQSTTSVLLRTTIVLLQYYSVLQSTKYYIQRTTPVVFSTSVYYKVLFLYYKALLRATK